MSHKLGICIPYRNREEHVSRLIPHLSKHLTEKGIDHAFYVGHQIDDKLFNRGAMKNIAAHIAFEDGCDYIAWHDVDMLIYNLDGIEADYSYPEEHPIHIATKLSKYNYGMGYDQYFGGVVLFTKEQAYQTNGYSNEYWDWGQEDDDLFWRCHFEKHTTSDIFKKYEDKRVANFNGINQSIFVHTNREISSCLNKNHTISILFSAEQQPEKMAIWLVGDENRRFIEYPILRKSDSWTWGVSFNNSRAISMTMFDVFNQHYYNWGKRFENQWTWVTMSYSKEKGGMFLYLNDDLTCQMNGIKENKPFPIGGNLKSHNATNPFTLGYCNQANTHFKGKIAEFKIYDRFFDDVNDVFDNKDNLVLHVDFTTEDGLQNNGVNYTNENIEVVDHILPYRREGKFYCLPHVDEGFMNGRWAKGETTARNEKRFVTEMQQGKIDYKKDGLNNILEVLDIDNVDDTSYPNTKFINVRMK
jgi:hypothetical protein